VEQVAVRVMATVSARGGRGAANGNPAASGTIPSDNRPPCLPPILVIRRTQYPSIELKSKSALLNARPHGTSETPSAQQTRWQKDDASNTVCEGIVAIPISPAAENFQC
jgi:hypothetical protein